MDQSFYRLLSFFLKKKKNLLTFNPSRQHPSSPLPPVQTTRSPTVENCAPDLQCEGQISASLLLLPPSVTLSSQCSLLTVETWVCPSHLRGLWIKGD